MKVHMRNASFLQQLFEHSQEIVRIEVTAMHIRKHKITIFPITSLLQLLLSLLIMMLLKHNNKEGWKTNEALTCCRFRFRLDIPIPRYIIYCMKHEKSPTLKINI